MGEVAGGLAVFMSRLHEVVFIFLIQVSRTLESIQPDYAWPVGRHSYITAISGWPHNDGTPTRGRLELFDP